MTTPTLHKAPDVAELRRRLDAAATPPSTDAPWYLCAGNEIHSRYFYGEDVELCSLGDDSNAALIAAAVNALPALLDDADALRAELAHMAEARDAARAEVERLTTAVEAVRALADEWTYKGEFGWDDGSHAYGPDCEGQALDHAAAELRRILDEEAQS